MTSLADSQHD